MAEFYSIWTNVGKAKLANKIALNQKLLITQMALGDGGKDDDGGAYQPSEAQEALKRERYRGDVAYIEIDADNENWINTVMTIPPEVGGFYICEAGLFDEDGDMVAIASIPISYKPVLDEGASKDITIKITTIVSNTEYVTLKVNPLTIIATIEDLNAVRTDVKDYTDAQISSLDKRIYKHYTAFAQINSTYTNDTPFRDVLAAMTVPSILRTPVTANAIDYPADGLLEVAKYAENTAKCLLQTNSTEQYILTITPENAEQIFGGGY